MNRTSTLVLLFCFVTAIVNAQEPFKKTYAPSVSTLGTNVGAQAITSTKDGGYVFSLHGSLTTYLCKADANWNVKWVTSMATDNGLDITSIIQTQDRGYILTGGIYSLDISNDYTTTVVMKFDSLGNNTWSKVINTGYNCIGLRIFKNDTSYVIGTRRGYGDNTRPWYSGLIEIDTLGNVLRAIDIDVPRFYASDVATAKKGYTLSGFYRPDSSLKNYYCAVSLDSAWNINWSKVLGNRSDDGRCSITALNAGGYMLTGEYNSGTTCSINVIRLKSNGTPVYSKTLSTGACDTRPPVLTELSDTSYIIGGNTTGKVFLLNFNSSGSIPWSKTYTGGTGGFAYAKTTGGYTILMPSTSDNSLVMQGTDSAGESCEGQTATSVTSSDIGLVINTASFTTAVNTPVPQLHAVTFATDDTASVIICQGTVLPLQLLSFTAQHSGKTNKLSWSTAQEINTGYFEIQRSNNGKDFTTLGSVTAKNSNTRNDYTYTDNTPLSNANYYRLKMVDKDGHFTYSAVKNLNNLLSIDASIRPNPAKDYLKLTINSEKAMTVNVSIVNMQGKVLQSQQLSVIQGTTDLNINLTGIGKGLYLLKLNGDSDQTTLKFTVQ